MATNTAKMGALMFKGMNKIVAAKVDDTRYFEKLLNVETSDKAYEVSQSIGDFGTVPRKPEGTNTRYDDPIMGFNKTFFHLAYSLGYRITEEAVEDDQYAILGKPMANKLGHSCVITQEYLAASIFNNGFGDATNQPDGVPLFTANHPLLGGGFYGNAPTTPVALSTAALQTAFNSMQLTVDDRGKLIAYKPKLLVVHPNLQYTAQTLLRSILLPGTSNNDVNVIAGEVEPFVYPYLTNPNAWFLLCDKQEHELVWYNRKKVTFKDYVDHGSDDRLYKASFRISSGNRGWRGTYGSSGS